MIIPITTTIFRWKGGSFRPTGELLFVGDRDSLNFALTNPPKWDDKPLTSARIIVGFNVGDKPTHTLDDLVKIVLRVREAQGADPGATFLSQKGVYKHETTKDVVVEDGAQVFILNFERIKWKKFRDQIVELAETIAAELKQEAVIVEFQKNGVTKASCKVLP